MKNLLFLWICLLLAFPCGARTITVNWDGSGDYLTIQAAINDSNDGDTVIVAEGTYTGDGNRDIDFLGKAITVCSIDPNDPNIVAATIIDCNGTQTEPHRGFYFHSGEEANSILNGLTVSNGYASGSWPANCGGGIYCDHSSPRITNCTISTNSADGRGGGIRCQNDANPKIINCNIIANEAFEGGGISCRSSSPIITDSTISRNSVDRNGGGVFSWDSSSPTIANCIITDNYSPRQGGGVCGGLGGSGGPINNCTITGNSSDWGGGGMKWIGLISNCSISNNTADNGGGLAQCSAINDCTITGNTGGGLVQCGAISNCTISENTGGGLLLCGSVSNCAIIENIGPVGAGLNNCSSVSKCIIIGNTGYEGGGLLFCDSITNCAIIGNTAEFGGGAARCGLISNCTFSNNQANADGGGIYCCGNDTILTNSVLWGDTATRGDEIALFEEIICPIGLPCEFYPSSITVSYCDVQGGPSDVHVDPNCTLVWSSGNIDADPCFADPNNDDYHLKSQAGRWDPNSQIWVQDDLPSPCVDAGDPNSDWTAELWPHGKQINMGAYGGTPQASMSLSDAGNVADLNNDDSVNYKDLMWFADDWLYQQVLLSEDLDRNGIVNFTDFAIFADNWLWTE